jgi:UDP-glucose 4-epimerase
LTEEGVSERYLLTGGAGFIGAALTHALVARGDAVTILDSGAAAGFGYVERTGARLVRGDVRDAAAIEDALAGCSAVVHLAAQVSVPDSIERPIEDLATNVDASVALLEAARRHGVRRFISASSNAVVSGHPPPANEALTPRPVSPYGAAKAAVEAYLLAYHSAFGLAGVALRFANAYGPWSAHKRSVVAAFVRAYIAGGPLIMNGDGTQTRDFVHVDDIVSAMLACLDTRAENVAGQVFQVGTGHETSLNDLARLLFEVGGTTVAVEHRSASRGDVARNVSDISKLAASLDYRPKVALRDGLAQTLEWFRGH